MISPSELYVYTLLFNIDKYGSRSENTHKMFCSFPTSFLVKEKWVRAVHQTS